MAPMPGTLDAIRKRMKSIQAANAGKPPTVGQYTNGWNPTVASRAADFPSTEPTLQVSEESHPLEDKALSGLQARMERLKSGGVLGSFV